MQTASRKPSIKITFNGYTKTLAQWAKEYKLKPVTLAHRIESGLPIEQALTSKLRGNTKLTIGKKIVLFLAQSNCMMELCQIAKFLELDTERTSAELSVWCKKELIVKREIRPGSRKYWFGLKEWLDADGNFKAAYEPQSQVDVADFSKWLDQMHEVVFSSSASGKKLSATISGTLRVSSNGNTIYEGVDPSIAVKFYNMLP